MALSRQSRKLIEGGDFSALEDQWLDHLAASPTDLAYFVGVARALGGSGEEGRAAELLELLDDHLKGEGQWIERLELLRQAGHLMRPPEELHDEILSTLHQIYPASPSRDGLIDLVGLHRAPADIPKTWEKVRRFRTLIQFEVGTVILMQGKGAGRVAEVNLELGKLKIAFDGRPDLAVGLAAAGKLLTPLPPSHFLYRKLEDPEAMQQLAREEPVRVLEALLTSHREPLAAGEIRQALNGVVESDGWSSWWSAARSHPQIVVEGKGARQKYAWADSRAAASDQILGSFDQARDLAKKLEIFRREAKRGEALKLEMADRLTAIGGDLAASEPAQALAVWTTLEKAGLPPDDDSWNPVTLVRDGGDPAAWMPAIENRALRAAAAQRVRDERADWQDVFARWLRREDDPRILAQLAAELSSAAAPELERFVDDVVAHPRRHATAFAWLLESMGARDYLGSRNPLRLLQLVAEAPAKAHETKIRSRLKKALAEGPVLSLLVSRIEEEQAEQAESILKRMPVPDYLREQLRTQLHLRFSHLGEAQTDLLYALGSSIEARRRQLKQLLEEEIPANRRAIEEARALGDLRENFEYKSARQRHEYLSARVGKLETDLRRARPIDLEAVDPSQIRIGTVATLKRNGEERRISILGPWESDPDQGVVSYEADTARRLIGKQVGDPVEFEETEWSVSGIERASV